MVKCSVSMQLFTSWVKAFVLFLLKCFCDDFWPFSSQSVRAVEVIVIFLSEEQ